MGLPPGLYDLLSTPRLQKQLEDEGLLDRAIWQKLSNEEAIHRLSVPLAREIAELLLSGNDQQELFTDPESENFQSFIKILKDLQPTTDHPQALLQLQPESPGGAKTTRPDTPLAMSALLTGSSRTPSLKSQLIKELSTCDRADWLVSFIKYSGIIPILPILREFTQTPNSDGSPRLRIATTSYMGATDLKAIKELLTLPNTEIRISYDTKRTRLHAKAYIFHRESGFGAAYIGSANVSKAALDEGLEWTAKISQYETDHLWRHVKATFETHWEDKNEFTSCQVQDLPRLENALAVESGSKVESSERHVFFDLRPYNYQEIVLQDIDAERCAGKKQHLIIAATGIGKTMIAGFDYKRFSQKEGGRPRLLFIAHREEILKQARASFRQILKDGSFGEIVVSQAHITQYDYLFCTVASWNSRNFQEIESHHFDYVVLDEAHHGTASSYQKILQHIQPKSLLGLTATPERTDGHDIRSDFGGVFTHEIRLTEAIEKALLCPFHYYGIPDVDGLDFSSIAWKNGGYDTKELQNKLNENKQRAQWVMTQTERYVADIKVVRGLGFCVSIKHAEYMAQYCTEHGVPSMALSADSSKKERKSAQSRLARREIRFIFTVDLYNEGVDIPFVDTVIFLRPTESLTVFLQQLGRGLRLDEEKPHLTVLDFIAPQHQRFSFAQRFQALSANPQGHIKKQIEEGMPFVPAGCLIHLEEQARQHILENIEKAAASLRGQRLIAELRQMKNDGQRVSLQEMLNFLNLDNPDDLYRRGLPHQLIKQARDENSTDLLSLDKDIAKGFRRLLLLDDTELITDAKRLLESGKADNHLTADLFNLILWKTKKPGDGSLRAVSKFIVSKKGLSKDLTDLLTWLQQNRTPLQSMKNSRTGPLNVHASYSREQIFSALGEGSFDNQLKGRFGVGVCHFAKSKTDIFFADINKDESDFLPTTMYEDYAINEKLFHWQSQSSTGELTPTGQRYINHKEKGYTPLLFVRERKTLSNGLTMPYFFAGPLRYRSHEGSRPMSIVWELEHLLPAKALAWMRPSV